MHLQGLSDLLEGTLSLGHFPADERHVIGVSVLGRSISVCQEWPIKNIVQQDIQIKR